MLYNVLKFLAKNVRLVYIKNKQTFDKTQNGGIHMKKQDEYKSYIIEMLEKMDSADETFLKQIIILIKKHLERKRGH